MPHLPYAFSDDDEFHHPVEGWLLLDRTIVFDSWLLWRHAMPGPPRTQAQLGEDAAATITALAEQLHAVHQRMPGYAALDDTPFVFCRWWEPWDSSGWQSGDRCVFRVRGHGNEAITTAAKSLAGFPGQTCLRLAPVSGDWMGARLLTSSTDPACPAPSLQPSFLLQRRKKRRTPLPPLR